MMLAEALHLRSDLQKRLAQLQERLINNAKVQEGDLPAENPEELLAELERSAQELEQLIVAVNLTNARTKVDGVTLTELLAKREVWSKKLSIQRVLLNTASEKVNRYSNTEIRIFNTVDVRSLQQQVDRQSKELRELDVKIQSLNWTTALLDLDSEQAQ